MAELPTGYRAVLVLHDIEGHAMREVAAQKYDTPVPGLGRANEIGLLAAALEVFKFNGIERQRLTEHAHGKGHRQQP